MPDSSAVPDPDVEAAEAPPQLADKQQHWRLRRPRSTLARLILVLNLVGLLVLVIGALVLNEFRRGLIEARIDSLTTQGELIADVIEESATQEGQATPALDPSLATDVLQLLYIPKSQRVRLFDAQGQIVADSALVADRVEQHALPPARKPGQILRAPWRDDAVGLNPAVVSKAQGAIAEEVKAAMLGHVVVRMRSSEAGERLVSVSIPIQRVQAVLGVLTLEAGDFDQIVRAQRVALLPFILIAVLVALGSSLLLNRLVALPIERLARAADSVRLSRARAISLPDISEREDEVGDLARSLDAMTSALTARMGAIERFAADVAHEIRNPLTSIRSAVETLELAPHPAARERLLPILKKDVSRLDRLITDISNSSRLDAELSRETPRALNLERLLKDIVSVYEAISETSGVKVKLALAEPGPFRVLGREAPLSQVFRNLIDNARSFSPPKSVVTVRLRHGSVGASGRRGIVMEVEDDGPGIPAENLENIFERFYTNRPKDGAGALGGAAFGGHSGLGLSIALQIVEAHGGKIRAENRPGPNGTIAGARFIVQLPEPPA
ncbi:MAG: stimulus-sensing domain-containing protein [Caulobacteraceae bacterium]